MAKHKTKIGKNAIETLTLSMYDDHKTIYREYIQNSADAIDNAVKSGLLEKQNDGYIEINIDIDERQIIIEDNGTGVKSEEAERILKDVAASDKNRDTDKGFRGIGRLAGLAYCSPTHVSTPSPQKIIDVAEKIRKSDFVFDDLSKLTNAERKLVSKVFGVIADNLPDKKIIPSLVTKVKEAFK